MAQSLNFIFSLSKPKWSLSGVRLQPTTVSLQPFLDFAGPNLDSCRWPESGLSGQLPTSPHCLFRTCFSLGRGRWREPSRTTPTAWFNLKKMEFQPSLLSLLRVNEGENNEETVLGWSHGPVRDNPPYSSHIADSDSREQTQSLQISVTGRQNITVPIFLIFLELEKDDEVLFLLNVKVISFLFSICFIFP